MSKEIWKDVKGYESIYQVSSRGRVKRVAKGSGTHPGKILCPSKSSTGYLVITLCKNGDRQNALVHRLVAEKFLGPAPSPKHQINHKNGERTDDCIDNLEWVTPAENMQHSYDVLDRLGPRGEAQGNSRLTEDDVRQIRQLYATGQYTQRELARLFGVGQMTISDIVRCVTWKHVGGPTGHVDNPARGETNGNAKLTESDVREIRRLYATGLYTQTGLGEMFGVSHRAISDIVRRETWKHVP